MPNKLTRQVFIVLEIRSVLLGMDGYGDWKYAARGVWVWKESIFIGS